MRLRVFLIMFFLFYFLGYPGQNIKKGRGEVEISFGQFWIKKPPDNWKDAVFERNLNSDGSLSVNFRLFGGCYFGFLFGFRNMTVDQWTEYDLVMNYFWLEDRYGDFLVKDYLIRWVTKFQVAPYLGLQTKVNLFSIKLGNQSLTPYLNAGVKYWLTTASGFFIYEDGTIYENGVPYLIYHFENSPVGRGWYVGKVIFWYANPDGTKGEVYRTYDRSGEITYFKVDPLFFGGGGLRIGFGRKFGLEFEFSLEKMAEKEKREGEVGNLVKIKYQLAMVKAKLSLRY